MVFSRSRCKGVTSGASSHIDHERPAPRPDCAGAGPLKVMPPKRGLASATVRDLAIIVRSLPWPHRAFFFTSRIVGLPPAASR
jgi:hypothetical protein